MYTYSYSRYPGVHIQPKGDKEKQMDDGAKCNYTNSDWSESKANKLESRK
jgi:hypothetical protein